MDGAHGPRSARRAARDTTQSGDQVLARLDSLDVPPAFDLHQEPVAARVHTPSGGGVVEGRHCSEPGSFGRGRRGRSFKAALLAGVRPGEAFVLGQLRLHSGLFDHEGVACGKGFDFGVGEDVLADVVEVAAGDLAAHDLVNEPGLPLEGLLSPYLARGQGADCRMVIGRVAAWRQGGCQRRREGERRGSVVSAPVACLAW